MEDIDLDADVSEDEDAEDDDDDSEAEPAEEEEIEKMETRDVPIDFKFVGAVDDDVNKLESFMMESPDIPLNMRLIHL